MENNLENKARFFALYFGQKVLFTSVKQPYPHVNRALIKHVYKQDFLELKPLSSITDEDAIEVSIIWGSEVPSKIIGRSLVLRIVGASPKIETQFRNAIGVVDYLRSKGYAIPYMGLSVETLIEYGWIKLKDLK